MTCIVAVSDGNKVYMAGDSCAVDDSTITSRQNPKVFINNGIAIGYCQSFRMGQIIQYIFVPPTIHKNIDLMEYMVTSFVPALKDCLDENDFPAHDDDKENWSVIVGIENKLFYIESDWQVGFDNNQYYAIGSGSPYALGAMYASMSKNPIEKLTIGLEAAMEFSPFVRTPFHFINT